MATRKMLIDSTHTEETRVVIVNGSRLEDFDVEVESRRQLKSNIYLAKVTRVEPSLQAAFVDFGGNRHGFLAFNEIHPDYYQIPIADREALLAEELEARGDGDDDEVSENEPAAGNVESVGGDDMEETETRRAAPSRRNYKIQEVIKRRQILLVQVVKEERGNKGAALTTYISLPGRYCVLMPNTARGGGISRKISNPSDRRKLKNTLNDLEIPQGMAVIVRTAGAKRTKAEIKRDYDYLMRLWNQIRETTLESIAPCAVYEEGNLIKRAIRDLYTKDIDEVVVEGSKGYRTAKDFMKLLIPSHAKRVQPYKEDSIPLFHHYKVEPQLDAMHAPEVPLKSGGYLVINQTEALVAIDVNSGKATRERNIEETALHTNLEAAEEVARQLRLRDLAGLVVIDFIDMDIHRNQTKIERQLKEAMRNDRARIQMGRISPFGLMELSRQRLRPSLMETSTVPCAHCGGSGVVRSVDSAALNVLRAIEEEGMRGRASSMTVFVATPVALYILNQKRAALADIENRYNVEVFLNSDDSLVPPDHRIERTQGGLLQSSENERQGRDGTDAGDDDPPRKKRRRRARRRRHGGDEEAESLDIAGDAANENETTGDFSDDPTGSENVEARGEDKTAGSKKRRRGKRGGRRRNKNRPDQLDADNHEISEQDSEDEAMEMSGAGHDEADSVTTKTTQEDKPKKSRSRKNKKKNASEKDVDEDDTSTKDKKPQPVRRRKKSVSDESGAAPEGEETDDTLPHGQDPTPKDSEPGAEITVTERVPVEEVSSEEVTIAAKTTTIVVGEEQANEESNARRGWWRR